MNKDSLLKQIQEKTYRTSDGLTDDMFLFVSSVTPLVNVDLLVVDPQKGILLSWRDDEHCGTGWHIPGGIIRHKETIMESIQKTALREFGCEVKYAEQIKVTEQLLNQEERNHFISLLYRCELSEKFDLNNANKGFAEITPGFLRWFDYDPGLVYSQYGYFDFMKNWFKETENNDK